MDIDLLIAQLIAVVKLSERGELGPDDLTVSQCREELKNAIAQINEKRFLKRGWANRSAGIK